MNMMSLKVKVVSKFSRFPGFVHLVPDWECRRYMNVTDSCENLFRISFSTVSIKLELLSSVYICEYTEKNSLRCAKAFAFPWVPICNGFK